MVFYTKQNYSHNYLRDSMHTIQYRLSKHITWTSSRDHTTHTKHDLVLHIIHYTTHTKQESSKHLVQLFTTTNM